MLRADIDHILVFLKNFVLFLRHRAVGIKRVARCHVGKRLVGHAKRIIFFRLVVLTHREANPVFAQKDAAHVGVTSKDDAVEVIHFTFVDIGDIPKVAHTGQHWVFAVCANALKADALTGFS